jgi:hypothetical protein
MFSLLYLAVHKRDVKSLSSIGTNQLPCFQITGSQKKKKKTVNDKMTLAQLLRKFPFFLSFFLSLDFFASIHCRCRGYSNKFTHMHARGKTALDEGSVRSRDLYLKTHVIRDKYPHPRQDTNPQSQQASGRTPTPQSPGHRDWPKKFPAFYTFSKFNAVDRTACRWPLSCGTVSNVGLSY